LITSYVDVAEQGAVRAVADAAAKKLEFDRNSSRGAMHTAEAKALLEAVLSAGDRKRYEDGDLMVKASLCSRPRTKPWKSRRFRMPMSYGW
jgi:hypothetical protein